MNVTIPIEKLGEHAGRAQGRVVVITGGASGIGKATALLFARYGSKVVIADVNDKLGHEVREGILAHGSEAFFQRCDVTVWEDQLALFEATIARFGPVDIVISVASAGVPGVLTSMLGEPELVDGRPQKPIASVRVLNVNLTGVMYTAHLALHYMRQTPANDAPKSLVLISSVMGMAPAYGAADYTASKHAVLGLSRALAAPYRKRGVKIASVHPWVVDTPMTAAVGIAMDGLPYTPLANVAGAILHAATDPDEQRTAGCAYVLPDDGPVVREAYHTGEGLIGALFARTEAMDTGAPA